MVHEIAHEPGAHRYALRLDGEVVAVLDYSLNANQISFSHTYTKPPYRGRGLAEELVAYAVDDVEKNTQRRIVPMCWYVSEWFDAHAERRPLLARAL